MGAKFSGFSLSFSKLKRGVLLPKILLGIFGLGVIGWSGVKIYGFVKSGLVSATDGESLGEILQGASEDEILNALSEGEPRADGVLPRTEEKEETGISGGRKGSSGGEIEDRRERVVMAEGELPSQYDSREQSFGAGIPIKDQGSEGLCWLNAGSTALELYLRKNGLDSGLVVSPKHMDYQMVEASEAYKAADVAAGKKNAAVVRYDTARGDARHLGGGGTVNHWYLAYMNPLAVVSENSFTNVLKSNDSRIAGISKFEDVFGLPEAASILDSGGNYTVKQGYAQVNNGDVSKFMVTDAGEIYYDYYEESDNKTTIVKAIKTAIKETGAAVVFSHWDSENCMSRKVKREGSEYYVDSEGRLHIYTTVIDRSNGVTNPCEGGHAMVMVGWDDDFEYTDNGETKKGAFILQNSWGETSKGLLNGQEVEFVDHVYMSYNSAFDVTYFWLVERADQYDHVYSVNDYTEDSEVGETAAGEMAAVFKLRSEGKEKIKGISFLESRYANKVYDVYVSASGETDGFAEVGSVRVGYGINKVEFEDGVEVDGEFLVKIERAENALSQIERALKVVTVFTEDAEEPGPVEPDPVEPDPVEPDPVEPDPVEPDPVEPDPVEPDPVEPDPVEPDPVEPEPTGEVEFVGGEAYTKGSGKNLVVRIDYPLEDFLAVYVDNEQVQAGAYTVRSGSTIITIKGEYLDAVIAQKGGGERVLKATFTGNRQVLANFMTVGEADGGVSEPDDGDGGDPSPTDGGSSDDGSSDGGSSDGSGSSDGGTSGATPNTGWFMNEDGGLDGGKVAWSLVVVLMIGVVGMVARKRMILSRKIKFEEE